MIGQRHFDTLYAEYKPRFIVIAHSYIRDWDLAEDLVNDSFLCFWEKRTELLVADKKIPPYILGILKYKCIDALRERQTQLKAQQTIYHHGLRNIQANLNALEDCDLAKTLFRQEIEEIFRRRLAEMPELSAQIFIANRFEEMTYQQIADRYGISVRKVTREIQRCLKLLREDLGDYLPLVMLVFPHLMDAP